MPCSGQRRPLSSPRQPVGTGHHHVGLGARFIAAADVALKSAKRWPYSGALIPGFAEDLKEDEPSLSTRPGPAQDREEPEEERSADARLAGARPARGPGPLAPEPQRLGVLVRERSCCHARSPAC